MLIFWIFFGLIMCFGLVLIFGAPYVPIHSKQALEAIELADLKPGEKFYELGCGDGKILILASRTGADVTGIELNPIMFLISSLRTAKIRNVKVRYGNFWSLDLSDADCVYVFLLDKFMAKLDQKLSRQLKPGSRLVSYVFKIKDKKISSEKQGLYLYRY